MRLPFRQKTYIIQKAPTDLKIFIEKFHSNSGAKEYWRSNNNIIYYIKTQQKLDMSQDRLVLKKRKCTNQLKSFINASTCKPTIIIFSWYGEYMKKDENPDVKEKGWCKESIMKE